MAKISRSISLFEEYDNHYRVETIDEPGLGLRGFIAIHRNNPEHPSFGATRFTPYDMETDAVKDVLKLSRLMSYKSALAQLPYGGAKGVIINSFQTLNREKRRRIFSAYCRKVNDLEGKFITGADVGINFSDLALMYEHSKFVVGLKSNPVAYTALGLLYSLEVVLKEIFGDAGIGKRSFAIQGGGKIGSNLLKLVYPEAKRVYVTDTNVSVLAELKKRFPKIRPVKPQEIYEQKADVFCPCALSNSINQKTLKKLDCKIILGGANNQLESGNVGEEVFRSGILYAPDYVVNAGGLISVTDEFENPETDELRLSKKVKKIASTLKNIISESKTKRLPTDLVANQMAEAIINKRSEQYAITARI